MLYTFARGHLKGIRCPRLAVTHQQVSLHVVASILGPQLAKRRRGLRRRTRSDRAPRRPSRSLSLPVREEWSAEAREPSEPSKQSKLVELVER